MTTAVQHRQPLRVPAPWLLGPDPEPPGSERFDVLVAAVTGHCAHAPAAGERGRRTPSRRAVDHAAVT